MEKGRKRRKKNGYRGKAWVWMLAVLCLAGCGKSKETEEKQLALRSEGIAKAQEGDYEGAIVKRNAVMYLFPRDLDYSICAAKNYVPF
jgi:hypothetical protein